MLALIARGLPQPSSPQHSRARTECQWLVLGPHGKSANDEGGTGLQGEPNHLDAAVNSNWLWLLVLIAAERQHIYRHRRKSHDSQKSLGVQWEAVGVDGAGVNRFQL